MFLTKRRELKVCRRGTLEAIKIILGHKRIRRMVEDVRVASWSSCNDYCLDVTYSDITTLSESLQNMAFFYESLVKKGHPYCKPKNLQYGFKV